MRFKLLVAAISIVICFTQGATAAVKNDILGLTAGISYNEFLKAKPTNWTCTRRTDYNPIVLSCILSNNPGQNIVLSFAAHLNGNPLTRIGLQFHSPRPSEEIIASLVEQYGKYIMRPYYGPVWSLDGGNELGLSQSFGTDSYTLELYAPDLQKKEADAVQDEARRQNPIPKF